MLVKKCLNSGFCCRQSPCGFGHRSKNSPQCTYLKFRDDETSYCGKYEEIVKEPSHVWSPAFGSGCCSSMNTFRENIKERDFNGVEQYIEIEDF